MVVRRNKHRDNFTVMPHAIRDAGLSWEAIGTLYYLLTKSSRWRVDITDLQRASGFGRHKIYSLLTELKEAGFVVASTHRTKTGRFTRQDYTVSDLPLSNLPQAAEPRAGEPRTVNRHGIENTENYKNTEKRKYRGRAGERGREGADVEDECNPLIAALKDRRASK